MITLHYNLSSFIKKIIQINPIQLLLQYPCVFNSNYYCLKKKEEKEKIIDFLVNI